MEEKKEILDEKLLDNVSGGTGSKYPIENCPGCSSPTVAMHQDYAWVFKCYKCGKLWWYDDD